MSDHKFRTNKRYVEGAVRFMIGRVMNNPG